jgi:predicted ATP-dependent serine protease
MPGIWLTDEDNNPVLIDYEDLDGDIRAQAIRPIGGFIFEANQFLAYELPPPPFYVKDWLPQFGKMLVYAPTKSGKSYLAIQLARAIGSGSPFLTLPTIQGKVLYIQFELGESVLRKRMADTHLTYENVYVGTSFTLKLDSETGQSQLHRAMEAVQPDVLILDPWYKAIKGDENEGVDVRPILDFLDAVIEAYHCAVVIVHHAGKDLSRRGRGSSVIEDWVDSYVKMYSTSKKGEPLRVKIQPDFLRHAPIPEEPIVAELGPDFEFHEVNVPTIKDLVTSFIHKSGTTSPARIFEAGIGSNKSVYQALKSLVEEGKVEKAGRGEYKWL